MYEIDLMTDDRIKWGPASAEEPPAEERPRWLMPVLIAWIVLVLAALLALPYAWGTVEPAPAPSQPDECTAEYVAENGICLTWHDYHGGQPVYSEAP